LTSRVTVNRIWQHLFGRGLGRRRKILESERGAVHPELLDWVAREFMRLGWSRKELIRMIVSSAAYRQSAQPRPELATLDPNNTLLARQSRFAWNLKSSGISISLLVDFSINEIKGPSFHPPAPEDFKALGGAGAFTWVDSDGPEKYRRGLYVFSQRTVP